ncbi:MAG: endonuclease, partial [Muribaculaceae bacterium]|nr:endonuclease [Muribaculaceae bacterium]
SGAVFEPADEYKGDFARGFFYMATVYDDISWAAQYDWMFTKSSYPTLQPWAYEMLLQWGRLDPVSQKEILRNDAVEISQGNRNPFVDFPELAEYIWGTRTSEVFLISEQGGQVTPPITGDPELTMPVNGEAIDFGQTAVGGSMTAYVTLRGGNFREALSVRVGGADKDMFNLPVRSIPASSINTTGEYLLAVEYTPASIGRHTATLGIYDGGMESTVGVTLIGEGCPVPQLSPVVALPPVDVTDYAYTAAWIPAPVDEAVDYYVIYRTRYLPDGAETDQLEASGTSLRIEGRDPAVMETYQVCSSRLGFLSDPSEVITVETSGVDTLQADGSLIIGRAEGGIRIITDLDAASIDIHDAAGLHLGHYAGVAHGDFIPLPPGVYLVTSPALRRPVKIII